MDFILFLVFAGIIFLITAKPFKQLKSRPQAPTQKIKAAAVRNSSHSPARAAIPALLGIEITRIQQRRLGKNDPSVQAANRAKRHDPHAAAPSFFEQMGKKIEKAVLDMNEAAQQKTAAAPLKKEDLATMLNDLFSNKK